MIPSVLTAQHVNQFIIRLRFSDGTEGDVDLREELYGPVFEPLNDPAYFRQFSVHPELHTLMWPNGADFSPEFLYSKIQIPT